MKQIAQTPAQAGQVEQASLWRKLALLARRGSLEIIDKALCLHYAAIREETPAWARSTAWAALAYLVLPADAIPDWIPLTGYSDDLVTLGYAVVTISRYVDEEVRQRASETMARWFPDSGKTV